MADVHISPCSGTWYPENAADLDALLEERFEESRRRTGPHLFPGALGFVVPHAGPAWSGTVAAAVYRSLRRQQPERIVVLAFPHHGGLSGVAAPDVGAIATPFGEVTIHRDWCAAFPRLAEERVCDHSFEIQLPFLQKAVPQARLTALYVGRMDASARAEAADQLAAAWSPGTVFVASSDFTHYGRGFGHVPFAADAAVASRLYELDHEYIDAAGSLDSALFLDTLAEHDATVCGSAPMALLLDVLRRIPGEGVYQFTLDYQTSGDRTQDYSHSVSYAALGYFPRCAFDLNHADCETLLDVAHDTLRHLRQTGERRAASVLSREKDENERKSADGGVRPTLAGSGVVKNPAGQDTTGYQGTAALTALRGAFVSLHHGGELLGCVGNCRGRLPLAEEIAELTLGAALEDPRFRPATAVAGPIDIELSILTPFRRIRNVEEFRIGRHGALLRMGRRSGLLLPQVAESQHWTPEEFWRGLARKSQLGPHAWRDPKARLEIFEAQVFARDGD